MISERKAANALGGKTARACDGCLRKRARWFCPADDAFLCQACDASVHSANQLASRHSRVWLEAVPSKTISGLTSTEGSNFSPSWHQGFTRKARTPRHKSNRNILVDQEPVKDEEKVLNPLPLVPEIGNEEGNLIADDNEDDQLLCRVPVFDPFEEGLCDILTSKGPETDIGNEVGKAIIEDYYGQEDGVDDSDYFSGFQLPSDMDLAKFAADVDNLLGSEFDEQEDDYSHNKELGLEECEQGTKGKFSSMEKAVKVKDEAITDGRFDPSWPDHRNFDFELPVLDEAGGEEEEEKPVPVAGMVEGETKEEMKKKIFLRLNYEAVITAWASQGSPRTTGSWPQLSSNSCLPSSAGACPKDAHQAYGGLGCRSGGVDEGREARVMRYKEKRRTRLFSKKIRYEVRKLNAEKRPRMKGRFVKRTSFVGTAFPYLSFSK